MRLAVVRKRFNPFGGAERFIVTAAGALIARGVEVTVVTEDWSGGDVPGLSRVVVPKAGGLLRSTRLARFQAACESAIRTGGFDLVQTHERLLGADLFRAGDGVHAAWIARLGRERGPLGAALLRLDPMHRLVMATERAMAASNMLFVANSELVAGEIRDLLGVPETRLRVIENGVDLDRFRPAEADARAAARTAFGLSADVPVVAFVGSGFERKGAFALVEALARPELREVHALVAGADRQLKKLRQSVERLGLSGRVQILGGIPDPRAVLAAADLFALPSLYDPMPNAALEALACGLPVVTCEGAGIATAVAATGAGAVVTRDREDLASGLARTLARLPEARTAAAALRPSLDLTLAVERWRALYDELLANREPHG